MMAQLIMHKHSLSAISTVCTTLHPPAPILETALTLTSYSVPASSPVRRVNCAGGEPEREVALIHIVKFVPILLYSTWYWEMVNSLWGVDQDTFRVNVPLLTNLVAESPVTLEGAVKGILESSIPFTLPVGTPPHTSDEYSTSYVYTYSACIRCNFYNFELAIERGEV